MHPASRGSVPRDFIGNIFEAGAERFTVAASLEFNPAYRSSVLLQWRGRPLLHLFYSPRNEHVNPRSCQAKVANAALYSSDWPRLYRLALRAIGWTPVRLARIDICADFQYFAGGRLPLRFVQDYLSAPRASRPSFIRKSSNKFRAAGVKGFDRLLWETLSWGTRDSAVQVNLYNKTRELMAKQDKQYIRAKWADYGLPSSLTPPVKDYVWRVEFSINPSLKFVAPSLSRPCREILLEDVDTQGALEQFFRSLVPDYFQFYFLSVADRKSGRRVKDLTPVVLFNIDEDAAPFRLRGYSNSRVSDRTERMLLRRLDSILGDNILTAEQKFGLRAAVQVLSEQSAARRAANAQIEADDLLADFLLDVCRPSGVHNDGFLLVRRHRELKRLVAMLRCSSSPSLEAFGVQYQELDACIDKLQDEIANLSAALPDWFFDAQ